MAPSPITSWQIEGEKVGVTDFSFLDAKTTTDGDCRHAVKRHLLLGRKAMTNLDSILKAEKSQRPILSKLMVFPGVPYECESRGIKKAKC